MNDTHPTPATLDRAGIAARIPHARRMCLLARLDAWSDATIECTAVDHRDAGHPLRLGDRLPSTAAVEYASQAMALHGSLAAGPDAPPRPGFLAAVRELTLHAQRLDDIAGELRISATRRAGGASQALYDFALRDAAGTLLVEGRATVVLDGLPAARPA